MSTETVLATIHFVDGSRLALSWPRRSGVDPSTVASTIRQALEGTQLSFAVDGDLLIVPMQAIKYVQLTPAPANLPGTVIVGARIEAGDDD